jgi:tRNA threonylcarbamoyladenosine biosynthesis protein TsaB
MKLLAFDTSTDSMSIAVQHGDAIFEHTAPGGAQASSTLIPAIEALMQQAGLAYGELNAIVFGRGPGSFTGLRTACSVAQGLAFGAACAVLPVDTLLAVAQQAHMQQPQAQRIWAMLDARMGEVYASCYEFQSCPRNTDVRYSLIKPEDLSLAQMARLDALAGNVRPALDAQLPDAIKALPYIASLPTARALLQLAPGLIAAGGLLDAEQALPLYIRDKVAQTTAERQAQRAAV